MITIIEDTAQKAGKHDIKHSHFESLGINVIRNKLPFGDYCLPPKISVDTKKGLQEVAYDIINDHRRFRAECVNAANAGTKLVILIEEPKEINSIDDVSTWENPERNYRPTAVTGDRLAKSMRTMEQRYGVQFVFCRPEKSADMILKLLEEECE